MRFVRAILIWLLLAGAPILTLAQGASPGAEHTLQAAAGALESEPPSTAGHNATAGEAGEEHLEEGGHGLPAYAIKVFQIGPVVITNSMVVTILVTLGIVAFAQIVSRRVKPVPSGLQNFAEWMVESMYNFLVDILGEPLVKKTFWFFGTIFFFILFTNWFGLVPGVGTIGWNVTDASGHTEFQPWLRGGNADLNMTSAMALLFFALWIVWAIQANGIGGTMKHIFAPGVDGKGFMKVFMVSIFLFVGVLETLSILFRPVALSFRLYGNIFAGENVLESMMNLVPWLGWLIPLPFYFLELLVGLVQALVFMLLTAVFTLLIVSHDDHPAHEAESAHH